MGQGGTIELVNLTNLDLQIKGIHSYQMNSWDSSFKSLNQMNKGTYYVEFNENLIHTHSDDGGEVIYGNKAEDMFEIQARWERNISVKGLFNSSPNRPLVVSYGCGMNFPNINLKWESLKSNTIYNLDWSHDGTMCFVIIDLSIIFNNAKELWNSIDENILTDEKKDLLLKMSKQICAGTNDIKLIYTLEPAEYKMENVKPPTTPIDIGYESSVEIPSGAEATHEFNFNKTINSTFAWSFNETLAVGMKVEWEAGVPFASIGGKQEFSINAEVSSGQEWSKSSEENYGITESLVFKEPGLYDVKAWVDWVDNIKVPFSFKAHIEGDVDGQKAHGVLLKTLLGNPELNRNFNGRILESNENSIIISISGTFLGTYGIKTYIKAIKK